MGIDSQTGFKLKGAVQHSNSTGCYSYTKQGSRSFYFGDVLYNVTPNNLIKMNDMKNLDEINHLEIGPSGGIIRSPVLEGNLK